LVLAVLVLGQLIAKIVSVPIFIVGLIFFISCFIIATILGTVKNKMKEYER